MQKEKSFLKDLQKRLDNCIIKRTSGKSQCYIGPGRRHLNYMPWWTAFLLASLLGIMRSLAYAEFWRLISVFGSSLLTSPYFLGDPRLSAVEDSQTDTHCPNMLPCTRAKLWGSCGVVRCTTQLQTTVSGPGLHPALMEAPTYVPQPTQAPEFGKVSHTQ